VERGRGIPMSIPRKLLAKGLLGRGGTAVSKLVFAGTVRTEYQRRMHRESRRRWVWPSCISAPARGCLLCFANASAQRLGQLATSDGDDNKNMGRRLGRLVVVFTTALIFFISYTPQIFIIWPWYGRELSVELLTLLVPFKYDLCDPIHIMPPHSRNLFKHLSRDFAVQLLSMRHNRSRRCSPRLGSSTCYFNDALCLCMLIQAPELNDTEGYEVKKLTGSPRYCRMCKRFKPPRAHHCKTCRRYASVNYILPFFEP